MTFVSLSLRTKLIFYHHLKDVYYYTFNLHTLAHTHTHTHIHYTNSFVYFFYLRYLFNFISVLVMQFFSCRLPAYLHAKNCIIIIIVVTDRLSRRIKHTHTKYADAKGRNKWWMENEQNKNKDRIDNFLYLNICMFIWLYLCVYYLFLYIYFISY